ncbi:murein hydrolase activator EnvC family protein [Arenibaculum sp.]|jgi:septal ring factor EnvC (AmiA/AmiB activator)|uniref:murein hydrolase activator EnvC family protein n=1 Tax=Arenibaculum sp. TaxID=2865862 RepID=UPI002E13858B|nr:peptidoglycan DD-metalloendopeptidase family protein [Arenibaculum sp.]
MAGAHSDLGSGGGRAPVPVLLALCAVLAAGTASAADNPAGTLQRVERELTASGKREAELKREAGRIAAELGDLRRRLVEGAAQSRAVEHDLAGLEEKLRILQEQEVIQTARLEVERARVSSLLGALQRLSRVPTEALAVRPEAPVDTLRGALLLRSAVPELDRRAEALAGAIRELGELRAGIAERRAQAEGVRADLARRATEIEDLVRRREQLAARTDEERREMERRSARLAAEAKDLRSLLQRIEAERVAKAEEARRQAEAEARVAAIIPPRPPEQGGSERHATLVVPPAPPAREPGRDDGALLPAAGRITVRYGEPDRFGNTSRGLTISARPGTQVVAPFDGSIMFAGPFKGYGQILIVEHAGGYHSLIAGLGRIDTRVGQQVLAGEPVGIMAAPEDGNPDLYFELRRNGQPINPQRGMAALGGKGQG